MKPAHVLSTTVALAAALALAPASSAQLDLSKPAQPKTYVTSVTERQIVAAGKPATLELRFQVVSGFHVNSHTPKSDFLVPTVVTVPAIAGVKPGAPLYPHGTPYSFSFDPSTKLDVYQGTFSVKVPVVASKGEHDLEASLRYQACDTASCYPPRTVPVHVQFNAK